MMALVILGIVAAWLLVSVLASLAFAALGRAGLEEDRSRGLLVDRHGAVDPGPTGSRGRSRGRVAGSGSGWQSSAM